MKRITKIEPARVQAAASKIRVAAYCRGSTEADIQLSSLETQKSHYEKLISANPDWEFAGLYYDEGISGTNKDKRPALLQMITDCETGKIDRILTKSLSRFARNTADCLELTRELLDLGVTIYFEKENLDTGSMESELLLSIMSSLAESESVSNSENNKWSVRHRFESGTYKLSYAPFGYNMKDGEMTVNEDEARWVRWIFARALEGQTGYAIAKELNKLRVPTRKGGRWTSATVREMLMNEKYIGACLFQKTYTDHRFKRHHNYGDRDQFYVEGHHTAIIPQEDFDAVGALMEQRAREKGVKKKDPRYKNRYPFTGKLVCGGCSSRFKRHISSSGNVKHPVWACKQHLEDAGSCGMKYIRESDLECAFMTMMNKLIFARREILHMLLDSVRYGTQKSNLRRIEEIDRKLDENAERIQTLTMFMTQGYIGPALFNKESNELAAESKALEDEKEHLSWAAAGNAQRMEELIRLVRYVDRAEPSGSFDGSLAEEFLDHATVHSKTEITFHLKCGLDLLERM